jgi:hypothetical protein
MYNMGYVWAVRFDLRVWLKATVECQTCTTRNWQFNAGNCNIVYMVCSNIKKTHTAKPLRQTRFAAWIISFHSWKPMNNIRTLFYVAAAGGHFLQARLTYTQIFAMKLKSFSASRREISLALFFLTLWIRTHILTAMHVTKRLDSDSRWNGIGMRCLPLRETVWVKEEYCELSDKIIPL